MALGDLEWEEGGQGSGNSNQPKPMKGQFYLDPKGVPVLQYTEGVGTQGWKSKASSDVKSGRIYRHRDELMQKYWRALEVAGFHQEATCVC